MVTRGLVRFAKAAKMSKQSTNLHGAIAQLGERIVRNDEVVGSIPTSSTNLLGFRLRAIRLGSFLGRAFACSANVRAASNSFQFPVKNSVISGAVFASPGNAPAPEVCSTRRKVL